MGKRTGNPRGRPPGSQTRKTQELVTAAQKAGITPLEVMLQDMRTKYAAGDIDGAADRARDCAPFMHPRLTDNKHAVRRIGSLTDLDDNELAAILRSEGVDEAEGRAGTADPVH